jgi:hypothetical protein
MCGLGPAQGGNDVRLRSKAENRATTRYMCGLGPAQGGNDVRLRSKALCEWPRCFDVGIWQHVWLALYFPEENGVFSKSSRYSTLINDGNDGETTMTTETNFDAVIEELVQITRERFEELRNDPRAMPLKRSLPNGDGTAWKKNCARALITLECNLNELLEDFYTRAHKEIDRVEKELLDGEFYFG